MSACPACGAELFGWLEVPAPGAGDVLLQRCEECGLGVAGDLAPESARAALLGSARSLPDGRLELRVANRASIQARLGGRSWTALDSRRRLYPTPESLRRLAMAAGLRIEEIRCPRSGRGQAWMWQTIVNGFTFNDNVACLVLTGRPRPPAGRVRLAVDVIVSALAALPVAVVSVPLELVAALAGRGGELAAL